MTQFNPATDEPSQNDSFEKSLAHKVLTLDRLFKGRTYQESAGTGLDSGLAPVVDASVLTTADGKTRLVFRGSLELSPDYLVGEGKLWSFVQPLGDPEVPAAYKAD